MKFRWIGGLTARVERITDSSGDVCKWVAASSRKVGADRLRVRVCDMSQPLLWPVDCEKDLRLRKNGTPVSLSHANWLHSDPSIPDPPSPQRLRAFTNLFQRVSYLNEFHWIIWFNFILFLNDLNCSKIWV